MNKLQEYFDFFVLDNNIETLFIAFSGGLDSSVLLYLAYKLQKKKTDLIVECLHINHDLQKDNDKWQMHCKNICKTYNLKLHVKKVNFNSDLNKINQQKLGIEAWARQIRYEYFKNIIFKSNKKNTAIFLGHHKNDNAETFLLQACRGSGIAGLAGMGEYIFDNRIKSYIARPLLKFSKAECLEFSVENKIKYITDASNFDNKYRRNFIRNKIIPNLENQYPEIIKTLARSSENCANSFTVLQEYLLLDLKNKFCINDDSINLVIFLEENQLKQQELFKAWLQLNHIRQLSKIRLENILSSFKLVKNSWFYNLYDNLFLGFYNNILFIYNDYQIKNIKYEYNYIDNFDDIPKCFINIIEFANKKIFLEKEIITFENIKIGDKIYNKNNNNHKSLKNYFNENKIAPWLRKDFLTVKQENKILCVIKLKR